MPGKYPKKSIQRRFIKKYEKQRRKALFGKHHLLFYDPTHQIHNTVIGKCWQKKGERNTIRLESNTGRDRVSILGAINVTSKKFTSILTEDNCDKEMNQEVMKEIRKDYPDNKKIILILDNASYNKAQSVKDIAKTLNIQLWYLPPYSPNLNLIERIWKFLKKVLKNKYISTLSEYKKFLFDFCAYFDKYQNEINRIISQKFEIL